MWQLLVVATLLTQTPPITAMPSSPFWVVHTWPQVVADDIIAFKAAAVAIQACARTHDVA
jgi:hypothetical protein